MEVTYVSVFILSCSSWRFAAISSPQGEILMWQIGFPLPIVRITRWKYEGGKARVGRYFGRSPAREYV